MRFARVAAELDSYEARSIFYNDNHELFADFESENSRLSRTLPKSTLIP